MNKNAVAQRATREVREHILKMGPCTPAVPHLLLSLTVTSVNTPFVNAGCPLEK